MSDIYVFGPKEEDNDYSSMGLAGALEPSSVVFKETLNGESMVTVSHPLDEFGAYLNLVEGNILVVPVPVRTTPEIQNGKIVTTVWTYKVKPLRQLTSTKQRTLYKKKTGSGKKKVLPAGTKVTVVEKSEKEKERWKVKSPYGTGWITTGSDGPEGFELVTEHKIADNSKSIEEIQSPWTVMDQYFRIHSVTKNMDGYEVEARHISYDLLYNASIYESKTAVALQTALNGVLKGCMASHDFEAFTNVSNAQAGLFYRVRNPIDIFVNEEDGLCTKYDVCLVRDNYSLYFLHDPGLNRGVRIQYGKNMTGIDFSTSTDEIATRIVPIGEKKDGTNLYLSDKASGRYVDSPKINNYPYPHVYELKCENCKVGDKDDTGGKITTEVARARMKAQAQKLITDGCDTPKVSMSVEFVNLGDTEEYRQFKDLENVFLADYVIIQHPYLNIDVTARITEIEWDCLLNRMNKVTIGEVGKTLANTGITSWQIPTGISGGKIADGTLGSAALKDDIINVRHMQADSVNTDALQAASVTAEKLAAGSITADKIQAGAIDAEVITALTAKINSIVAGSTTTDTLYAALADITTLMVKQINAENIDTNELYAALANVVYLRVSQIDAEHIDADELSAAIADFVTVYAGTGEFDFATIQNLVAKALSLEQASAESVYIKNLAVTSANLLSATLGKLVIKGEDGKYYRVFVGSDGAIATEEATLTEDELSQGQTASGQQIVETQMNVADLNASNLQASSAVINTILATALTAEKITAADALIASATIPTLYVTSINAIANNMDISANQTIQLLLGANDEIRRWFTFSNEQGLVIQKPAYTDSEGVEHPASIWQTITDETGYHIKRMDLPGYVGSFARDRLIVDGVETGEIATRKTANGGWAWVDA